jgi:uncharacterized protein (UPF0297 family)
MDKTSIFNVQELRQEMILMILNEIIESLNKKGYNAENQLVGYLLTGDPTYISNFENAREKAKTLKREEILLALIKVYEGK